jgi:RhoGEF domain
MKSFVNRPIPRLLRYELLLKGIMEETQEGHDDHVMIPNVIDVIKALGKESEPGVTAAKEKVELWKYNANIVFHKPGEFVVSYVHVLMSTGYITGIDRIWTSSTAGAHSYIQANFCASRTVVSNGIGATCSSSFLITIVSQALG